MSEHPDPTFGPDYDWLIDGPRVKRQMDVIKDVMLRRRSWATLREISIATGYPESSVSAQLRHLRKSRFGSYDVRKRRRSDDSGTWEYFVQEPLVLDGGG